jgi:hypothetical protein
MRILFKRAARKDEEIIIHLDEKMYENIATWSLNVRR